MNQNRQLRQLRIIILTNDGTLRITMKERHEVNSPEIPRYGILDFTALG